MNTAVSGKLKKAEFPAAIIIVMVTATTMAVLLFRTYLSTLYTMAWDMSAHTWYGAELAHDLRLLRPLAFLHHINSSSIALWPFLHPVFLAITFLLTGFKESSAVIMTLVFSVLSVLMAFCLTWLATGKKSVIPGLITAFLMLSSPYYLGYSTYIMLEVFGVFFLLSVCTAISLHVNKKTSVSSFLPAIALLLLFLTKINYGLYFLIPYLFFELFKLEPSLRKQYLCLIWSYLDIRNVKNILNWLILVFGVFLVIVKYTSPFNSGIDGWRLRLTGVRDLLYILLWLVFIKTVVFIRQNRHLVFLTLKKEHRAILRIVVIPLFFWFLINNGRLEELIRMSSERTTEFTAFSFGGLIYYPKYFAKAYCPHISLGITVITLYFTTVILWKGLPKIIQFLIVFTAFGYISLTLKLVNFAEPRFFFLHSISLFVISGFGIWHIAGKFRERNLMLKYIWYGIVLTGITICLIIPVRKLYRNELSRLILESAPTSDERLDEMVQVIASEIRKDENRITIIGGSNEISPYLVKWNLLKSNPDSPFVWVEFPVKTDTPEDQSALEEWLKKKPVDTVISVVITRNSPYAQSRDFRIHHAWKQTITAMMGKQDIYIRIKDEKWRMMAVGIRLYRPVIEKDGSFVE